MRTKDHSVGYIQALELYGSSLMYSNETSNMKLHVMHPEGYKGS